MSDSTDHLFDGTNDPAIDLAQPVPDAFLSDPSLDAIHGEPESSSDEWFLQMGDGYCMPASLTQVLSEATDIPLPDESLVLDRLAQLGAPDPTINGLPIEMGEPLLESFGIPCHVEYDATLSDLQSYLDDGRSIILGVNADYIWEGANDPVENPMNQANHALIITAIDEDRGVVVLSDPGTKDGNQETVQLSLFLDAWESGDNQLLVTDIPTQDDVVDNPNSVVLPVTVNGNTLTPTTAPANTVSAQSYTVRPGDTMWDIAEQMYGDGSKYQLIADASGITTADLIHPGQTLTIPSA